MIGGRTRLGHKKLRGGSSAAARKLKKSRTTSALGNLPPLPYYNYDTWSVISDRTHLQQVHDPYALPKKDEPERARVVLSQDPLVRVMIGDAAAADVDFESLVRKSESERSSLASSSIRSPPQVFSPGSKAPSSSVVSGAAAAAAADLLSPSSSSVTGDSLLGQLRHWLWRTFGPCVLFFNSQSSSLKKSRKNAVLAAGPAGPSSFHPSPRVSFAQPQPPEAQLQQHYPFQLQQDPSGRDGSLGSVEFLSPQAQRYFQQHRDSRGSVINAHSRPMLDVEGRKLATCCFPCAASAYTGRGGQGRVTNSCLWHSCRAITLGAMLIIIGMTMAILGFLDDQRKYEESLLNPNTTTTSVGKSASSLMFSPGLEREDRLKLNNLSFAGPVVMGVGGFLIVAACVMTFEARDNAAKVVPSAGSSSGDDNGKLKAIKFRSSSSQTTFLDRNIVETLGTEPPLLPSGSNMSTGPISTKKAPPIAAIKASSGNHLTTAAAGASYHSGSSHSTKRASFNGKLPEASDLEPGLALMDEIGRRALTNAFINFSTSVNAKNPTAAYRDSLIYADCKISSVDAERELEVTELDDCPDDGLLHVTPSNLPKCPSAPNIAHHKLDPHVVINITTPSDHSRKSVAPIGDTERFFPDQGGGSAGGLPQAISGPLRRSPNPARQSQKNKELSEPSTVCGQYRVLTPTMYRSHMMMANTRQAVSMDYENTAKARREGPSLRISSSSPFQRENLKQDSLDLELGASATGVHRLPHNQSSAANSMQSAPTTTTSNNTYGVTSSGIMSNALSSRDSSSKMANSKRNSSKEDEHSDSSMVLDLHVEGQAPITLLVRDESRSTRSTSGNRETTTSTSCTGGTRSLSRSPAPPSPPSLIEQMSCESKSTESSSPPRQIENTSIFGRESLSDISEREQRDKETKERQRIQQRRLSYRQSGAARNRRRNRRNSDPSSDAPQPPVLSEDEEILDIIQRSTSESDVVVKESGAENREDPEELLQAPATTKERKKHLSLALQVTQADYAETATASGAGRHPPSTQRQQAGHAGATQRAVNFKCDATSTGTSNGRPYNASKSYEEPACSPFGEVNNTRWSRSLAEELASLSYIDANAETSPEEQSRSSDKTSPRQRSLSGSAAIPETSICRLEDISLTTTSSSTSSTTLMVMPYYSDSNRMRKSHTHHSLQQYSSRSRSPCGTARRVSSSSCSTLGQLARLDDGPTMMAVDGDGEEERLFMEIAEESATPPGEQGVPPTPTDETRLPPLEPLEDDKDVLPMVTSYSQDHQAGLSRRHLLRRQAKVQQAEKEEEGQGAGEAAASASAAGNLLDPESANSQKTKRSKTLSF